jgi:hypothetical protein
MVCQLCQTYQNSTGESESWALMKAKQKQTQYHSEQLNNTYWKMNESDWQS